MVDRVLVVGPPGGGKSSFASSLAGYVHLEGEMFRSERDFRAAVRLCDEPLLAVVRCCYSRDEFDEWVELVRATRVVVMDPGLPEVKRRLLGRDNPNVAGELKAAGRWYRGRRIWEPEAELVRVSSRRW